MRGEHTRKFLLLWKCPHTRRLTCCAVFTFSTCALSADPPIILLIIISSKQTQVLLINHFANYQTQVLYEAYGPGGTGFVIECLTDNVNRSASEVRGEWVPGDSVCASKGVVFAPRVSGVPGFYEWV